MEEIKLRTLKDLKYKFDFGREIVYIKELKAEAIKYVEDLQNAREKTFDDGEINELNNGELADLVMKKIQVWIKHFFNLTEEDLK